MKLATVFRRRAHFIIHPSSCSTDGLWIGSEPYVRLPVDCTDGQLGATLLSALESSKTGVPHPTEWKGLLEPLLQAAGVKSWGAFAKNAVCVLVSEEADNIELVPTVNLGAREGFEEDEEKKKSMAIPVGPDALGTHVREAIALAR